MKKSLHNTAYKWAVLNDHSPEFRECVIAYMNKVKPGGVWVGLLPGYYANRYGDFTISETAVPEDIISVQEFAALYKQWLGIPEGCRAVSEQPAGVENKSEQGLKTPFRQVLPFGCGGFSLANLFNKKWFMDGVQMDGERTCDMNKKMQMYYPEWFIETLFLTSEYIKNDRLTDTGLFWIPEDDTNSDYARPYLFISYRPEQKLMHYFLVMQNLGNNMFYVVDSKQEFIQKFTIEQLLEYYWVIGVEYFGEWTAITGSQVAVLKSDYPHIFLVGE